MPKRKRTPYSPKKKKYSSLTALKDEMESEGIAIETWNGYEIITKDEYSYGMYAEHISIRDNKSGECIQTSEDS